jgi:hypothetical protein
MRYKQYHLRLYTVVYHNYQSTLTSLMYSFQQYRILYLFGTRYNYRYNHHYVNPKIACNGWPTVHVAI